MPRKSNAVQEMAERLQAAKRKRFLWIHRPIFVHRRNNSGSVCICGCNSRVAHAIEEQEHIDLLVDRRNGQRWLLQKVEQKDKWRELAATAERVDVPLRAHPRQLELILDKRHKVIAAFGGERGGKTSFLKEWIADFVFLEGGPGTTFWWVAPEREKTQIGVDMLFRGYATDRWVPPVFPRAYQAYYPDTFLSANQRGRLIDGTEIPFLHAGGTGRNLKGRPAKGIVVDEGCEIDHESNWQTLLGRTMDADAKIAFASTPVLGSWAKEQIADAGRTLDDAAKAEANGIHVHTIAEKLTCEDNPWLNEKAIRETILAKAGTSNYEEACREPKVRREVFGEWVGEGEILWRHFKDHPTQDENGVTVCHLRSGPARDVDYFGLVNVTGLAYARHFKGTGADLSKGVLGFDFNEHPNHGVLIQVGCPKGLDQSNSRNWIAVVLDTIVKHGTLYELTHFLSGEAARKRRLPSDYYAGMAMVADGTSGNPVAPSSSGPRSRAGFVPFRVLEEKGFPVRPPLYTKKTPKGGGKPYNPGRMDATALMHKMMRETVRDTDGNHWPRLLIREDTCQNLIEVLQTQEGDQNGLPLKVAGTKSDRDCGQTEALAYVLWPVFHKEFRVKKAQVVW